MAKKTKGQASRRRAGTAARPRPAQRAPGGAATAAQAVVPVVDADDIVEVEDEVEDGAAAALDTEDGADEADRDDDGDEAADHGDGAGEARPAASAVTRPGRTTPARGRSDGGTAATAAAASRRVGRVDPASRRTHRSATRAAVAAQATQLDPDDASIPLDRVPYALADLRRVGVIALAMVVLIVIADIVVSVVVK